MTRRRLRSLQSSKPTEWVTKVLVQRRIATKKLETAGETMQTTTMACCWVEASVLMVIMEDRTACERLFHKATKDMHVQSGPRMFIAKETDTWSKKHRLRLTGRHKAERERRELHSQCARDIHVGSECCQPHKLKESCYLGLETEEQFISVNGTL